MKKIIVTLCVIYSMLIVTACPSRSTARKAAEASYQFSGLVRDLAKAADRAYTEGLIDTATKDRVVTIIRGLNSGAKKFNALASEIVKSSEKPDQTKLETLNRILSDEIITPFLQVLTELGAVAVERAEYLRMAINAVRVAILTVAGALAENGQAVNTGGLRNV